MKKIFYTIVALLLINSFAKSQDTMYVHQSNGQVSRIAVNKIDSVIFYASLPKGITTSAISNIEATYVFGGGSIFSDGGANISERGVCWSTLPKPTISNYFASKGSGIGNFSLSVTNLLPNTTYFLRAYATNRIGTVYGQEVSFTTKSQLVYSLLDIDGNGYNTVIIGTQTWMKENLRVTKYNDGTSIPLVTNTTTWGNDYSSAYCNYNNTTNTDIINTYGRLYKEYTVNSSKLCPTNWHVPSEEEWNTLITFLGGKSLAGNKLNEIGFTHWDSYNTDATNETDFTALPGGSRDDFGVFADMGSFGYWWSSTEGVFMHDGGGYGFCSGSYGGASNLKNIGHSIRCLRDF